MANAAAIENDGALEASPPVSRARASSELVESLRGQLQAVAPNQFELALEALTEAMQAKKKGWGHCSKCNAHTAVEVLDSAGAVQAVKALVEMTEGRAAVAGELSQSPLIVRVIGRTRS